MTINRTFMLSQRSISKLSGVHTDLIATVQLAITISDIDFCVIEGIRDHARQELLVAQGKSHTLNSRHLSGHAVDLAPLIASVIPWHDWEAFRKVAHAMQSASAQLGHDVIWGGNWAMRDGPHFELSRQSHPLLKY